MNLVPVSNLLCVHSNDPLYGEANQTSRTAQSCTHTRQLAVERKARVTRSVEYHPMRNRFYRYREYDSKGRYNYFSYTKGVGYVPS